MINNNQVNGQQLIKNPEIDIGSKRQLFVDNYLIQAISGEAEIELHNPVPGEIVLKHDAPWEGNSSVYHSVFKDGEIYRMYYRGSQIDIDSVAKKISGSHPIFFCYAESKDGINWVKPNLGLYEYKGSKKNNIILANTNFKDLQLKVGDNASFFKDENPNALPSEKYKAFVMSSKPHGLLPFKSADGIHWEPMHNMPVITNGAFDSQNIGFWDSEIGAYRAYWRYFQRFTTKDTGSLYLGVRAIRTATSKDFINWENQTDLKYESSPHEQLYTNQIFPYYRAPQLLVGFPNRYIEREWSPSMYALPEVKHRQLRSKISMRYGTGLTDALFMSSRNGTVFNRWNEAFFRSGIERPGTWNYGQHYVAWGMLETKSSMVGAPNELSFYSAENFWTGTSNDIRRYTLRIDGFASLSAPMKGGEVITKPFKFDGKKLSVNFATSIAGSIKIEIQDVDGNAIPGFTLAECSELYGDTIDRDVSWKGGNVVGNLLNHNIRLRIVLKDADLYSFKFY
ncbi:MAG: hypothetical protein B7X86_07585 [Sphingobacteriales bacterium 17-39-43]|nr:MAG: hypothetical protein B7Y24_08040 [Sphingobacteriales bacterium 16-39-50]OYZ58787.1 MAG: hypothetical protein B7Y19_01695 [Sphingobacteriales bacterium 24-40-4]OZA24923.1 MAG: hypothetical protein B7X86_07585 [Sphingobacteriales bacterium 17-39-43]